MAFLLSNNLASRLPRHNVRKFFRAASENGAIVHMSKPRAMSHLVLGDRRDAAIHTLSYSIGLCRLVSA